MTRSARASIAARSASLATITARRSGWRTLALAWARAARPSSTVSRTASIAASSSGSASAGSASGKSRRWTESGSSPSSSASPPARLRWISSARKGVNGREQRRRLQQAVAQGREGGAVALPEAAAREPHVPVGELLDVLGDRPAGGGAVEVVHPLAHGRDRRLQPRERPAVEVVGAGSPAAPREVGRAEALGVGVEDPERVGVPEGEQELADRLADRVDREAVARPGLLGGQVVPAEGVGAVGGDHVPGLDDVAACSSTSSGPRGRGSGRGRRSCGSWSCRRAGSTRRAACRTSRGSGRSPRR